ncbi:hypothetical protein AcdelDRAFT_3529 [Acidovorax delafieldii 2AN]|uniref:IPTL-CTERM protein sorting domain-containing protein n=1 Tax=Acidovorax delafieldii 2AN TaxID=573060 RepID=C5T9E9_ACIDE|nr:hypothetical protein [Acidovorax delafieldii]EER58902.1 hypothetical protein AcdelDRAFT_3529 [Acidovorax delafieldii 2AN]
MTDGDWWGDDCFGAGDGTIDDSVVAVPLASTATAVPALSGWGLALLGFLASRGWRAASRPL